MEGEENQQDSQFAEQLEQQQMEIEALESIYPDELKILREKPLNFQIQINSNQEEEDNHLKALLIFDMPEDYPLQVPYFRIKNLCPDYIDNTRLDQIEQEMRDQAEDMVGDIMAFQLCDYLREQLGEINDKVLDKLNEIKQKEEEEKANVAVKIEVKHLTYTPVNKETFAIWCSGFLAKMKAEKELNKSEKELKPTGRELFEMASTKDEEIEFD